MHQAVAAGKIIAMNFNDDDRRIDIGTKIVDDAAWAKCLEGVYSGFSAGGRYVRKWSDPEQPKLRRFEAAPHEASLVDYPAVPTALFAMVKIGGTVEIRGFKKVAARSDTTPTEGKEKYGDVTFADPKNKKYPLDTKAHVRAALSYWGMPKNRAKYSAEDQKTIGARIHAAAKEQGIDVRDKALLAGDFSKGLWEVARLANVAQDLAWLQQSVAMERDMEGDDSAVPAHLKEHVEGLLACLQEMTAEEVDELLAAQKKAAAATLVSAQVVTTHPQPTRTAPMSDSAKFRKIAQKHLAKLADITEHAQALHKMFGEHVAKLEGTEHHELGKAMHTMLGDHCAKLEGFREEVGGLPETAPVGDEENGVTGAEKMAKVTAERDALSKRVADAETATVVANAKVAELDKALDEALQLGEDLSKALDVRKGTLLAFDRKGDGTRADPAKAAADDDAAKLTERQRIHKAIRGSLAAPMDVQFRKIAVGA